MKKILLVSLIVAFTSLSAGKALACVCVGSPRPLSDEEVRALIAREFEASVAVFSGEVVELDRFKVKLKVAKLWKGEPAEEITMSTGTVRIDETHTRSSSCDYRFKPGEKYLVYARRFEAGLVAYKCTGTKPLADAGRDLTELDNLNPNAYQPQAANALLRPLALHLLTLISEPGEQTNRLISACL